MLVQIIPLCTFHPLPPSQSSSITRIIQSRRGRSNSAPFCPHLPRIPAVFLAKVTFECVGFSEAFNLRGICISAVYPPTPTTLLPPSLTETNRARGEKEAIRRVERQSQSHPSSSSFPPQSGQCNDFPRYPPLQ